MLDSFGPVRTIEDVLSGVLRVRLGGETYVLPVRSIASNNRWVESLDLELGELMHAMNQANDDYTALTSALTSVGAEQLLKLVIDYDETGVLPPREDLEEVTQPHQALMAVMGIRRVQNPLADAGLAGASSAIAGTSSPVPTNSRRSNGASRRRSSSKKA